MVEKYGLQGNAVPIIIYKDKVWQGYNPVTAKEIADALAIDGYEPHFLLGLIDQLPLVLSTVIIGLVDGFNPCSLWALLFIMSMILRFQSKKLVLLLGLTYILVVTLIYGLFIIGIFGAVAYILEHVWLRLLFFSMAFLLASANIYSFFYQPRSIGKHFFKKQKEICTDHPHVAIHQNEHTRLSRSRRDHRTTGLGD